MKYQRMLFSFRIDTVQSGTGVPPPKKNYRHPDSPASVRLHRAANTVFAAVSVNENACPAKFRRRYLPVVCRCLTRIRFISSNYNYPFCDRQSARRETSSRRKLVAPTAARPVENVAFNNIACCACTL